MTAVSLHPTPEPRAVTNEALASVRLALRKEIIAFLLVLGVLAAFGIIGVAREVAMHPGAQHGGPGDHIPYSPFVSIPIALIGLLLPFGVWRAEDPSRREYFWAMPVARGSHTITKTLAGWAWLMAGTVVYLLWMVVLMGILSLISGGMIGAPSVPVWEWLVPFTSATIAYLIGSIAVIASDHPWRWIGGAIILWIALLGFTNALHLDGPARGILSLVSGQYGLSSAIFGNVMVPVAVHGVGWHAHSVDQGSATRWLVAMLVWGVPAAIGVWLAAYRRPGSR